MKYTRNIERSARRAAATAAGRLIAPMVRDAMADRKVRAAAGETYGAGRRVYEDVRGADPKQLVGRIVRDERLQGEFAALVRSATKAVDEGMARGRRRGRRRIAQIVLIGVGAVWGLTRLRRSMVDAKSVTPATDDIRVSATSPSEPIRS